VKLTTHFQSVDKSRNRGSICLLRHTSQSVVHRKNFAVVGDNREDNPDGKDRVGDWALTGRVVPYSYATCRTSNILQTGQAVYGHSTLQ
jgi:hypothetical protein